MGKMETRAVILAAGMGTRMASMLPKVLHPIGGRPMIRHLLAELEGLGVSEYVVVTGAGRDQVEAALPDAKFAHQEPQLGTGHAVLAAKKHFAGFEGNLLVLYGDVPLVRGETLAALLAKLDAGKGAADLAVLGFRPADAGHYGRLKLDADGGLEAIIEYKDAGPEEKATGFCNSGIMAGRATAFFELLAEVGNSNEKSEYYLTDVVGLATAKGLSVAVLEASEDEVTGINTRQDLARAEAIFQDRQRRAAMDAGATLADPGSVYFSHDTRLGSDVTVGPNVVFGPGVSVAGGATINAFCHLEGCRIEAGAVIGPFARLRPGAEIGKGAKIGNFVEIKKAKIGEGAKVNHLAYIGDASVGAETNVGAGTITCNYDGFEKHFTDIGKGVFIGSNSSLVAPVKIGDGAIVGAGSVITADVEPLALALGRSTQSEKPGWAVKFRALKSGKNKKD
ncbi:MAG: bifunctional UDP-N-acetylglucosamine diphosphorylase/glucosamine-1-phosphate N-acetyltransferase GlmU [Sphingomonadales bacterium]